MALISLPICFWFGEYYAIWAFLVTAIASIIPGQILYRSFHETGKTCLRHAMIIVVSLYRAVLWHFQRLSSQPHQLMCYRVEGKVVTEAEASRVIEAAAVLTILWIGAIILGVIMLLHIAPEYNLTNAIFEAASALGGVGLSVGITHPDLPWLGKLTLIFLMWMGRL
ncbi:MAG: hypothetical protein KME22_25250 [Hassallia sp. WJT32-NPBG1]|jgi:Trk-type K+ transport system membrane component|nr:hypothetical protein [Hassallia sp. WJT32-NPBG1]